MENLANVPLVNASALQDFDPPEHCKVQKQPWSRRADELFLAWPGAVQYKYAKAIDEVWRQAVVLDEEAHVDRSIEGVEEKIGVDVLAEFAAANRALESCVGLAATRP